MQKLYFLLIILCVAFIAGLFGYMNGQMNQFNPALEQELSSLKSQLEEQKKVDLTPEEPYLETQNAALKNRGTRGHASKANEWDDKTILDDYSRVGMKISRPEAEQIYDAIKNYTTPIISSKMRVAATDYYNRKILDAESRRRLMQYSLVIEYTRIAPPYPDNERLYKGFSGSGEYIKNLYELKAGDNFELEMPTNFDSRESVAKNFAGKNGAVLVIDGGVKNGVSLSGFSVNFPDYDVLVSDKGFLVEKISGDACRMIYLKVK